ncbi:MAG: protoheme IX farnesyltransferase [Paludibacter sp.]
MTKISFSSVLKLMKLKVSVAVTFTAIAGYIIFSHQLNIDILYLMLGVLLLASGSSALNQVQESPYDAIMHRTSKRPIPMGLLSNQQAFIWSVFFIISGSAILYFAYCSVPLLLGLFNVLWYNGIYTPLKRKSAFAVVPGSLVGAVPVYIGWTAAGGLISDTTILFVGLFLFIWQVPHFWLLMLKYGDEYRQAGFKTITGTIHAITLPKIIFVWVLCTSFSSLIVPLFLSKLSLLFFLLVFSLNLIFISLFVQMAFNSEKPIPFKRSFIGINVYMMVFMLFLIAFHLIS